MSIDSESTFQESDPESARGEHDAAIIDLADPQTVDRLLHEVNNSDVVTLIEQANALEAGGEIGSKFDFLRGAIALDRLQKRRLQIPYLERSYAAIALDTEIDRSV